ncbi:MAG: TrmH family RNA methyltransferase [archaeon]|jgi:hypothetical protein
MIFLFDNITDKIDFASILISVFESPKDHKFIFCGKEKEFYQSLIKTQKVKSYLFTYYPNLSVDFEKIINKKIFFRPDYEKTINFLKKKNYNLYGTTPSKQSNSVFELKLKEKSVFVFGSENGLSKKKLELLTMLIHYPLNKASFLKIRNIFPIVHGIISEKNFALKKNKMVDRSIKPKPKNTVKRFKRR